MIKRIIIALFLGVNLSFAAVSNESIINFYKERLNPMTPNVKVEVLERTSLGENGFERVTLEISAIGEKVKEVVFTNGNFLFPDIVDAVNNFSYREDFQKQLAENEKIVFEQKMLNVLKDEANIVSIGDKNKPEIYVFSDPECPYCRKHLEGIDKVLEKNRVNFVFVSVHGRSAFEKIANIYKETADGFFGSKSDAKKLEVIRKYYAESVNYKQPTEEEYKAALDLTEKYKNAGLRAVPTTIEKPQITKE